MEKIVRLEAITMPMPPRGKRSASGTPMSPEITTLAAEIQTLFQSEFDQLADWEQAWIVAALERVAAMLKADRIDAAPVLEMGEIAVFPASPDREKEEL